MKHFLEIFLLLLPISSIFIVSWYVLTRHYIVVNPDNTEKVDGYLLKWWSWVFEAVKHTNKIYYSGDALKNKVDELMRIYPSIATKLIPYDTGIEVISPSKSLSKDEINKVETVLQLSVLQKEFFLFFYIEDPVYFIPDLIRKPLSGCVRCMASLYGGLIWCFVNYFTNLFSWTIHPHLGFFFFGFIFCVILSHLNSYIYSKFNL